MVCWNLQNESVFSCEELHFPAEEKRLLTFHVKTFAWQKLYTTISTLNRGKECQSFGQLVKFELVPLNAIPSKVSCASWHLLAASQISLFFLPPEILFEFTHGYSVLKQSPFWDGNAKAGGMRCIFAEEMSKDFRTWPRGWSATCGLEGGKCLRCQGRLFIIMWSLF